MDRLLGSFRLALTETYAINYFLIGLVIVALLGGSFYQTNGIVPYIPSPNTTRNLVLYGLGGVVLILVIYALINSQSPKGIASANPFAPAIPNYKTFWTSVNQNATASAASDSDSSSKLVLTQEDWNPVNADLSLGVELLIQDSRAMTSTNPYRCLFYKGSADLSTYDPNSPGLGPHGSGGLSDGLPAEMSPGIFIDRATNDIIIYVDTDPIDPIYTKMSLAKSFRESIRINDLPLNIPFHLHLILSQKVLEVYVNCRLAGTKLLHGLPRVVGNNWFGLTGFSPADAQVQNLTLFDGALNSMQLMKLCKVIKTSAPTCNKPTPCTQTTCGTGNAKANTNVPNSNMPTKLFNYKIITTDTNLDDADNSLLDHIYSNDPFATDTGIPPPLDN